MYIYVCIYIYNKKHQTTQNVGTDIHEIGYLIILRQSFANIQASSKSGKNEGVI
jgi:hypothetical protein